MEDPIIFYFYITFTIYSIWHIIAQKEEEENAIEDEDDDKKCVDWDIRA